MSRLISNLGIGIIGCGRVAFERHIPALRQLPQAHIVAISDVNHDHLQACASQHNISKQYSDYHALIADHHVDIVAVLTPTGTHKDIGIAVMDASKHLFMEKPLALSVLDCDALVAKSQATSAKSIICFNLRCHRLLQQAQSIIESGELGNIIAIRGAYTHFRDGSKAQPWHHEINMGGGVTTNESVHMIDLFHYLLKTEATEVFALHQSDQHYEDVSSLISLRFKDRCLATTYNALKTSPNCELEIYGDQARLYINLYRFDGIEFYPVNQYPGNIRTRIKKIPSQVIDLYQALRLRKYGGDFQASFYHIWHHFLDCIQNNKQPLATFADGKQAAKISLAAIQSFKTKKTIDLS